MQALTIVVLVFAILSKGALIAVAVASFVRKRSALYIVVLAALGLMVLGDIFFMIPYAGTMITGCIFWLLAWPAFATSGVLLNVDVLKPRAPVMATPVEAKPASRRRKKA